MTLCAPLRRFAERCSRNLVFRRRMPRDFGSIPLRISPGASLSYWAGLNSKKYADLYDFVREHVKPGDCVWDVGANMGLLSFAAAHRVGPRGQVLAFEPDWWSCRLLHESRALNPQLAARLQILPLAVADAQSIQALIIPRHSRACSYLEIAGGAGAEMTGGERERLLVPTVSLDWVAESQAPPTVLKIDVDGGELRVLLGARRIMEQHRPRLLVEVHERNADAVGKMLAGLNYRMFSYEEGAAQCRPITRPSYNTLALPN